MMNAEVLAFVLYFVLMLAIGVVFFFKERGAGEKEYFLGGRHMGPWVTAMSAQASDMSAWLLMGLPGSILAFGFGQIWIGIGLGIGTIANWIIVARRLRCFSEAAKDSITLPQYLSNRFATKSLALQIICAVIFLVCFTIYVASAFVSGATVFTTVFPSLSNQTAMLIFAAIMAYSINPDLFSMFYVAVPILAVTFAVVMSQAFPRFSEMMRRYDGLNASVQENLSGIRVVKAYVREDHESKKFADASEALRKSQVRAENLIVVAMPMMMLVMYGCMIAVSWFGGQDIIGGSMTTGDLMSYISYIMQILMSLMMVAMITVQLVLSRASMRRIREVLEEKSTVTDENANPAPL